MGPHDQEERCIAISLQQYSNQIICYGADAYAKIEMFR